MHLLRRGIISKQGGGLGYNALTSDGGLLDAGTVLNTGDPFEVEFEMEVINQSSASDQSILGANTNAFTNFKASYRPSFVQLAWAYGSSDTSSVSLNTIGDVGGTGWHKYKVIRGASSAQGYFDDVATGGSTSFISNNTSLLRHVFYTSGQINLFSSNIKVRNLKVTQGGVLVDMSLNGNFINNGSSGQGTARGTEDVDYQFI
tara:strand:- start:486 stop:1094 length:609 start_codon:yes stop_codon:yes gene_type:complete